MLIRLLAPWILLIAAASLSAWLLRRSQAAGIRGGLDDGWLDHGREVMFQKGAWTYAFENAGAGASLVSLLVSGSYLLFDDPPKAGVFAGLTIVLAALCWPVTARRPWLRLTPTGIAWKPPQSSTIQEMPWPDVRAVGLAWHARFSSQVVIDGRHSGRKPIRIKARHLNVPAQVLVALIQQRATAERSARRRSAAS